MNGGALAALHRIPVRHALCAPAARSLALADLAVDALVQEALLTPKPALVDRRGPGAHSDLDLLKMLRSAGALRGCFRTIAARAWGEPPSQGLREALAEAGRHGEKAMLAATGGANAHRGAIWSVGLLVAAAAGDKGAGRRAEDLAAWVAELVSYPDLAVSPEWSNGARACARHGVSGARGEAAAGFPHVVRCGLPMLIESRRRGQGERPSRLNALMAIMSSLDDTCLLHRGGRLALRTAQAGAQAVLRAGGAATRSGRRELLRLDRELTSLNASPGGSADLLAATLYVDALQPPSAASCGSGRLAHGDV